MGDTVYISQRQPSIVSEAANVNASLSNIGGRGAEAQAINVNELQHRLCESNPAAEQIVQASNSSFQLFYRKIGVILDGIFSAIYLIYLSAVHQWEDIWKSDKTHPYITKKHDNELLNLNGKAKVGGNAIVCRHLVTHHIHKLRQDEAEDLTKTTKPHEIFGSIKDIQDNVSKDIEADFQALIDTACGKYIVPTDKFGHYLSELAKDMEPGQKKQFLLCSGNHAMDFQLEHKKPSKKHRDGCFVMRFFDPNCTRVLTRCRVQRAEDFNDNDHSLSSFINKNSFRSYFKAKSDANQLSDDRSERECLIYDVSNPDNPDQKFKTLEASSGLPASPIMLHHLMRDGSDPGSICDIAESESFRNLDLDQKLEIIGAENSGGATGLYIAMQEGCDKSVKAFASFLAKVPVEYWHDIVAAKRQKGSGGVFMALQNGHAGVLKEYRELLQMVPKEKRGEILASRSKDGIPSIYPALINGQVDAINEYKVLLAMVPKEERSDIIKADSGFVNTLMKIASDETIDAFKNVLEILPKEENMNYQNIINSVRSSEVSSLSSFLDD